MLLSSVSLKVQADKSLSCTSNRKKSSSSIWSITSTIMPQILWVGVVTIGTNFHWSAMSTCLEMVVVYLLYVSHWMQYFRLTTESQGLPPPSVYMKPSLTRCQDAWELHLLGAWLHMGRGPYGTLVPRPHPAHVRRRGLVSQVQILGLAPEAWSNQSNRRAAFIGIMRKREQVLQTDSSKCVMRFIMQFVIVY